MAADELTHLDEHGRARMVDVSAKAPSRRRALAEGTIRLAAATLQKIADGGLPKGDVVAVARLAGIQGAKRASDLVPLCHPLRLDAVHVQIEAIASLGLRVRAEVVAFERTGVEMEALAAVQASLLAVYDMVKAVDRSASLEGIRLLEKEGGRSGAWARASGDGA